MAAKKKPLAAEDAPIPVKALLPTLTPEEADKLVDDIVYRLFFASVHPLVRDGIREGVPKLLDAVRSEADAKLLIAAWNRRA